MPAASSRCEPFPAFPLPPGTAACPAAPSEAVAPSRCEPIPAIPLPPGPAARPAAPSEAVAPSRCEPIPAIPLPPGTAARPAAPSAAVAPSRCEPIPAFPLPPGTAARPAAPSVAVAPSRCEPFGDSAPTRHGGPPCGPVCGRCPRPGVSLFRRFRSYLALRPALRPRLKPLPRPGVSLFRRFRSHPARPTRLPTRHLCHQRYSVRQTPISPYRVPLQHHFVRQTSLLRTKDQTTPRPKESPPPNIPTDEPTPKVGGFFALFTPTFRRHRPHVALYGFPAPKVGVDSGIFSPTFRWRGGGAGWRTRGTTGRAARMGRDDTNCQAPSTSHPRQSTEASPACHRHPATPAARHRPSPAEHLTPGRKHLSPEESGARTAQENMEKCRTCHSSRYSCTPT